MGNIEDRLAKIENSLRALGEALRDDGRNVSASMSSQTLAAESGAAPRGGDQESYFASSGSDITAGIAAAAGAASPRYTIEVRFQGGLTTAQKNAFKAAADRWTRVIVGALPAVMVDGEVVQGVLILAQGANIDGPGRILGQAGPTRLRPGNMGSAAFLPAKGEMTFDTADLANMEADGTLNDVIAHEMGHVIGCGTIWGLKNRLTGAGTQNPRFTGPQAKAEYGALQGTAAAEVPVENRNGPGTADAHWHDIVFRNELMTGFVNVGGNPLSRLTVASMADLGYTVDLNAAEPYSLPNMLAMAAAGDFGPLPGAVDMHDVLPIFPMVLPTDSAQ